MHTYQTIIIVLLICLLFVKASRYGAFILITTYFIYYLLISDLSAIYYYSCTATLNLFVGLILHRKYKYAALCGYALVFVDLYGFFIWHQYIGSVSYDIISGVVLIMQLLFLLPNGVVDCVRGYTGFNKYSLAKSDDFDSK